ncbi:MAG: folylpolyglutamate synthase/dihydrofolate synthase family protein [Bacteroidota bacterium]|nr:folylpolyglutamate synthase/dihydrofolate synthase family protein [Bacteroidota bacterium]
MNYKETLDYLYSRLPMYHRIGAPAYKADLDNTIKLCRMLGDPQNSFKAIHIAGTNGKGSVSHTMASIFQEKGLKTGLYTSPHLKDFRERIRINGKMIPEEKVTGFVEQYRTDFESISLSFFEWTVGLAFHYFREENIDIAVVEVGLGGRLDSTNIITPLLSVITNISFDHMQFLGNTLPEIATEKAGIIKPGIPVVIGETHPETKPVFVEKARKTGSSILFADERFKVEMDEKDPLTGGMAMVNIFRDDKPWLEKLSVQLGGVYQKKNLATIAAACEMLPPSSVMLTKDFIRKGISRVIENTGLSGRWQVLSRSPLTICDIGHNEGGIREVVKQISLTPHKHLHFVIGMVNDKDTHAVLSLLPKDATYYFCKASVPRGLDAEILSKQAHSFGLQGQTYVSVKEALLAAQKNAGSEDLVFVGGSNFTVAEVI